MPLTKSQASTQINKMIIKNKKGVSAVVGVILMVALVIGLTAIVWNLITGVVEDELSGVKSCSGNLEKITLNNQYTCLNKTNNQLDFSIKLGDINVSEIIVTLSGAGEIKTFKIDSKTAYPFAKPLNGNYNSILNLPEANSGKTYSVNLSATSLSTIDTIEIAPVIGGNTCDISDSISSVDDCRTFF